MGFLDRFRPLRRHALSIRDIAQRVNPASGVLRLYFGFTRPCKVAVSPFAERASCVATLLADNWLARLLAQLVPLLRLEYMRRLDRAARPLIQLRLLPQQVFLVGDDVWLPKHLLLANDSVLWRLQRLKRL